MTERLQKSLSARGLSSRRKAEEWIQAGRVTCNGTVARLGDTADPELDEICVDLSEEQRTEFYRSLSVISHNLELCVGGIQRAKNIKNTEE